MYHSEYFSPVCKFCGKSQLPQSFVRFARNYVEGAPFHKISTPENWVKLGQTKNTLLSKNADDEKIPHPCGSKFIFLNRFSGGILFSSLISFDSCLCFFFGIKNVYSDTHSTMWAGK